MTWKPESVQERKMVFLWCITEFLAPVNQVKSRPCSCHHLQCTSVSCSLKLRSKRSQGSVSYWKLCPLETSSGVIHLCRGRWLQRFRFWWIYDLCRLQVQKQLDMKTVDSTKIKTHIMKYEIKLCRGLFCVTVKSNMTMWGRKMKWKVT